MELSLSISDEEMLGGEDMDDGMERTIVHKCYSKVAVSSTERNMDK